MARKMTDSFKRTVKFYDANFDIVTETAEGKIVTAKNLDEAKTLFGNDDEKVLNALNAQLRENQIRNAVSAKSGGMEERFIMGFIKPMRSVAPFNAIEDEKEQTKAILDQIKTVPFLLEGLKSYCQIRSQEADSDED